jgi:hypothetical protein
MLEPHRKAIPGINAAIAVAAHTAFGPRASASARTSFAQSVRSALGTHGWFLIYRYRMKQAEGDGAMGVDVFLNVVGANSVTWTSIR